LTQAPGTWLSFLATAQHERSVALEYRLSSVLSLSVNILEFELGAIERSDLQGCNLLRFELVN